MLKKVLNLILVITNLYIISNGQTTALNYYSVNDGLSHNVINCIFQDSEGFIWFGTQNGLNKFNGYNFKKYFHDPTDTMSILNSWIYSITEDNAGNIWIGTRYGLNKYDKKTNCFTRYIHDDLDKHSIYGNNVHGVTITKEGNIVANTLPAINILNPNTGKFIHHVNSKPAYSTVGDMCQPIIEDNEGLLWIASGNGLSCFNQETKNFTDFTYNKNDLNTIFSKNITALCKDKLGNIWIGTCSGLNFYDIKTKEIQRFYLQDGENNYICSITVDHMGDIWVSTGAGGLNKIVIHEDKNAPSSSKVFGKGDNIQDFFVRDFVESLYMNKSNVLWIGTINGVYSIDLKDKKFKLYSKSSNISSIDLLDNGIASIYKDNNNMIWIGNWGRGLNLYNRETGDVQHFSEHFSDNHKRLLMILYM